MGTGLVAALAASAVALPFVQKKPLPHSIGWGVPLACSLAWFWFLRTFFLR